MYQKNDAIKERFRRATLAAKERVRADEQQHHTVDQNPKTWLTFFEFRFGPFIIEGEKSFDVGTHVIVAKEPEYLGLYATMPINVLNKDMGMRNQRDSLTRYNRVLPWLRDCDSQIRGV